MKICINTENTFKPIEDEYYTCRCIYFNNSGDGETYNAIIQVADSSKKEKGYSLISQQLVKGTDEYDLFVKKISVGHTDIYYGNNDDSKRSYTQGKCKFDIVNGYPKIKLDETETFKYYVNKEDTNEKSEYGIYVEEGKMYEIGIYYADISLKDNTFTVEYLIDIDEENNITDYVKETFALDSKEFKKLIDMICLGCQEVKIIDDYSDDFYACKGSGSFIKNNDGWHLNLDTVFWDICMLNLLEKWGL